MMKELFERPKTWFVAISCASFLAFASGCEPQGDQQVDIADHDVVVDLQVESCPSKYRGLTNNFIRLDFEKSEGGVWRCCGVDAELLSPGFLRKLDAALQNAWNDGVRLGLGFRMYFPEDFPFPLRQALIALIFPGGNTLVETVMTDERGLLVSELTHSLNRYSHYETLVDRAARIKKEYDFIVKKGGFLVSIADMTQADLQILRTFRLERVSEYRQVFGEMSRLRERGTAITWTWGDRRYFEYVDEVIL